MQEALEKHETPAQTAPASGANKSDVRFDAVLHLCFRFHEVAKQLRISRANRTTVDIQDEYDVQDLMHALLRIFFDDVRDEEWTPRVDVLRIFTKVAYAVRLFLVTCRDVPSIDNRIPCFDPAFV